MRKISLEFLKQLLSTPSPSGHEAHAQKIWCDYARRYADMVKTDAYGNAIAILNPKGKPKIMLDGHIDEIGMIVKYIDDKGFVYVQRIGGVDPALISGKRVSIHSRTGIVRGVIGSTPIHLQERGKQRNVPKMHEVYVDIGATDKKAAQKRIAIGDPMTFVDGFEMLTTHLAVGRGMDNRVGTWAVIEALRLAKAKKPGCCIIAASSVQEEVGTIGAQMQAFNIKPDAAIVVDVTFATDTPGIDNKQFGLIELEKGPAISVGRENHPVLVERIRKAAEKQKITYQTETFSIHGGTDAMAIYKQLGGIPTALVSVPNRYMHTTVETIDLRDLQKTAELLAATCLEIRPRERFAIKV